MICPSISKQKAFQKTVLQRPNAINNHFNKNQTIDNTLPVTICGLFGKYERGIQFKL
jgi:hypothetical protein